MKLTRKDWVKITIWTLLMCMGGKYLLLRSEYAKAEKDKVWYCKEYNRMYNDSIQSPKW